VTIVPTTLAQAEAEIDRLKGELERLGFENKSLQSRISFNEAKHRREKDFLVQRLDLAKETLERFALGMTA
jgi:multidrug resistance efflux pump